jgi:hypothetical protein
MKFCPLVFAFFLAWTTLSSCESSVETETKADVEVKVVDTTQTQVTRTDSVETAKEMPPQLDTISYNHLVKYLSNGDTTGRWPVKHPYPNVGAILPFKRVVAYYGNLFSKRMGVLGEYPKDEMLAKLKKEVDKWNQADSVTPAIPALHYIAVTAQLEPGKGGKYRLRMPFRHVDTLLNWAKPINGIVFMDVQIGLSTLQQELPAMEAYLSKPEVHLGIDPEFSMKTGAKPGTVIGSMDADDVNYAIDYLASLVKQHQLPPKILVVHRFTQRMLSGYKQIKLVPEVQVVICMDGWNRPANKANTYRQYVYKEPVQFTGFKIFYKNDVEKVGLKEEMQPHQVLKLTPKPIYIQYQ